MFVNLKILINLLQNLPTKKDFLYLTHLRNDLSIKFKNDSIYEILDKLLI